MVYQGKSNFITRLISACILAPLVLYITYLSGAYFVAMVVLAAVIMGGEWFAISEKQSLCWKLSGAVYISAAIMFLIWLVDQDSLLNGKINFNGINTVISIFVFVWANDVGGYVFGKILGGKKLCPKISPNKTWAGFFGGMLCCIAVSPVIAEYMFTGLVISIVASAGDLLESWAKRKCNAKDSGNIIPGHGGLLDRVDSVLLVAIFVGLFAMIFQ